MEIQIFNPTQAQPLPPVQWNYEEVKQYVVDGLARYKGIVYDDTQIAIAKTDRANLNKLAAAIDAKRKEMKDLYLQPYAEFEAQAKELTAMVKMQVDEIDAHVKAFDNFRKEEKLEKIKNELYTPMIDNLAELVPYERLHDPRWLNVTCSFNTIGTEMAQKIERIVSGLDAIDKLDLDDTLAKQAKAVFLQEFDLAAAIKATESIMAEREKLERYQAAQQAHTATAEAQIPCVKDAPVLGEWSNDKAEHPVAEEKTYTVTFRIHVTKTQLDSLGAFMKANNIKPERVQ